MGRRHAREPEGAVASGIRGRSGSGALSGVRIGHIRRRRPPLGCRVRVLSGTAVLIRREAPRLWTVFDPEGRVLGLVETPEGLWIHEIGEDYILGTAWDALNVEYVQVWGLERLEG